MRAVEYWSVIGAATLFAAAGSLHAKSPSGTIAAASTPSVGQDVAPGERIASGSDGPTQILLRDGSTITLAPNSTLTLDRFSYDPETRTGRLAMTVTAGVVRLIGGRASKDAPATIETPSATIALHGGIGLVSVDPTTGATAITQATGRSTAATSKSTGETRTLTRDGYTLTVRTAEPITAAHIGAARLDALLARFAGGRGEGGATSLPDPNAPAAREIADLNSGRPATPQPSGTSAADRLGTITTLSNQLVAQTAQSTAAGRMTGLGSIPAAVSIGGQNFVVTSIGNGSVTLTSLTLTANFGLTATFNVFGTNGNVAIGTLPSSFAVQGSFFTFQNPGGLVLRNIPLSGFVPIQIFQR